MGVDKMDIKTKVINFIGIDGINKVTRNLKPIKRKIKEYKEKKERLGFLYESNKDHLRRLKKKRNYHIRRIEDNNTMVEIVKNLNFISTYPKEIEECLSPYGTLCDRENFYYDPKKLPDNDRQLAQAIICEISHALGTYFHGRSLTEKQKKFHWGRAYTIVYHIGLTKEDLWYSQTFKKNPRLKLSPRAKEKIICFKPNKNAKELLFRKAFLDNNGEFGKTLEYHKNENFEVIYSKLQTTQYNITKTNGLVHQTQFTDVYEKFFRKRDGEYQKTTRRAKEVKKFLESKKIADKLAGNY
jgi:hypothetical protein